MVPKRGVLRKAPFAISLAMLLAGCNEQWSISKVVVNPQPLSTDPVTPIVLVAPETGPESELSVLFEIEIRRDAGFQSPIDISVEQRYNPPPVPPVLCLNNLNHHAFTISGSSTRGSGHLLRASCRRTVMADGLKVWLDACSDPHGPPGGACPCSSVIEATAAKISVDVGGVSSISGSNDPMIRWNAPHALEISCLLKSPIN